MLDYRDKNKITELEQETTKLKSKVKKMESSSIKKTRNMLSFIDREKKKWLKNKDNKPIIDQLERIYQYIKKEAKSV